MHTFHIECLIASLQGLVLLHKWQVANACAAAHVASYQISHACCVAKRWQLRANILIAHLLLLTVKIVSCRSMQASISLPLAQHLLHDDMLLMA